MDALFDSSGTGASAHATGSPSRATLAAFRPESFDASVVAVRPRVAGATVVREPAATGFAATSVLSQYAPSVDVSGSVTSGDLAQPSATSKLPNQRSVKFAALEGPVAGAGSLGAHSGAPGAGGYGQPYGGLPPVQSSGVPHSGGSAPSWVSRVPTAHERLVALPSS